MQVVHRSFNGSKNFYFLYNKLLPAQSFYSFPQYAFFGPPSQATYGAQTPVSSALTFLSAS